MEFCYGNEAVDVINNPVMVDSDPPESAKEGPEPQPGKWPEVINPTAEEDRRVYEGDVSITLKEKNLWEK